MAIERGIVIQANGPAPAMARVRTVQPSACEACSSRDSCNSGGGGAEREVDAINMVDAKAGDLIQISMNTKALLKATFLLYIFPIICMLIGGIAGNALGPQMGFDPSLASAAAAIGCFAVALLLVRMRANHMALKMEYRPKITRILGRGSLAAAAGPDACAGQVTGSP